MNGVAERINRTLLDLTRSMLKSAYLPQKFWAEAVTTAAYIKNRVCDSIINNEIPFTVWNGRVPSVRHLKVYGCLTYARLPDQQQKKLDDRAIESIFVGYATQTRGYRLWCPQKGDVITTKHVKFAEDKSGYEWIYRKATQTFRHNKTWSDDEDSTEDVDDTRDTKSDEEATDIIPSEDADRNIESIPEDMEIVGARSAEEKRKAGRPKKKIRNPYGRKGKPKEAQTTNEEESSNEQSDIEVNLIEVSEPQNVEWVPLAHGAIAHQPDSTRKIDTIPDSAPTR